MTVIPPLAQAARLSFKVSDGAPFDWCSTTRVHFSSVNGGLDRTVPTQFTWAAGPLFADQ
jgi:hypothetical protein